MSPADIALAEELITQAAAYWASFEAQKNAGTLTQADLSAAAAKLDTDISTLAADIAART